MTAENNIQTIQIPDNEDPIPWSQWMRRVVNIGLIIAVTFGLLFAGAIYGQVVVAIFVCILLFGPIRFIKNRTAWSYKQVATLVFVLYLVILLMLIVLVPIPIIQFSGDFLDSINQLMDQVSLQIQTVQANPSTDTLIDLDTVTEPVTQSLNSFSGESKEALGKMFELAVGFAGSVASILYNILFIHIIAIMLLLELPRFYDWILNTLSDGHKREYGILLERFDRTWVGYMKGAAIVSIIGAAVTWGLLTILGIPNPLGITIFTTIISLIPFFGPTIATFVCFVVGWAGGSSVLIQDPLIVGTITASLFFFLRGLIVGSIIYPRVVGKSVDVPPLIILIALPFFGSVGGILGMFLSPVLAGIIRDWAIFVFHKMNGMKPFPTEPIPQFMQSNLLIDNEKK